VASSRCRSSSHLSKHRMVELMVATTLTSYPKSGRNRRWRGQAPPAHPQPRLTDQPLSSIDTAPSGSPPHTVLRPYHTPAIHIHGNRPKNQACHAHSQ
jgi:hypothetical protein